MQAGFADGAIRNLSVRIVEVARPERLELPTLWFEARCSIQLSYGRAEKANDTLLHCECFLAGKRKSATPAMRCSRAREWQRHPMELTFSGSIL